ncbi:hypothetical protein I4U23_017767 [Adineta vaga]|nr:hypothetical protein I4U23_017767 [Adineta vaga]
MAMVHAGGYYVNLLESFDEKYKCPICSRLLKDPMQLECGHRLCQTCIQPQTEFIQCIICQEISSIAEVRLDKGFRKDMETLSITCGSCEWTDKLKNYQVHLEKFHQQFVCSSCGEIFDSQVSIQNHEENLCLKKPINCCLHNFECKEQILRGEMGKHYDTVEHQNSLLLCINQIKAKSRKSATVNIRMETEASSRPSSMLNTNEHQNELEEFFKLADLFYNGVHHIKDVIAQLTNDATQIYQSLETTEKKLCTIKTLNEETNSILNAMHINLLVLRQELTLIQTKIDDQQVTSYDGTLVWRIKEVQKKMNDAKTERQTSIYSPPFRSSPTGYLMMARLYLHGDGNARRTHMSLFFVLLRGPHDSILRYPFNFKVTFCLYDQTPAKNHIIESFRPDTRSNSFQQPRSDMNIASGIPKFAPLSIFEGLDNPYVKDDTMFIKVIVDFENMSKAILPFVTKLNPGLPMHIQQELIQRELQQKSQVESRTSLPSSDTRVETERK